MFTGRRTFLATGAPFTLAGENFHCSMADVTWATSSASRPGVTDVMALRVGYEKLHAETGWKPNVSWEEGVLRTIRWYAENREKWLGRVDWLTPQRTPAG